MGRKDSTTRHWVADTMGLAAVFMVRDSNGRLAPEVQQLPHDATLSRRRQR
jgi:hypothetical protein